MVQALARHFRVQVAHAAGMKLDRGDAGGLLDFAGIHVGVDIGLHYCHAKPAFQQADGADEGGGFAAARRRHQIEEENALALEFGPEGIGILFVVFEDTFLNFNDFDFVGHAMVGFSVVWSLKYTHYFAKIHYICIS